MTIALLVSTHYESNGEAGDGQSVCDGCGRETDDGHAPEQCFANLRADIAALEAQMDEPQVGTLRWVQREMARERGGTE